MPTCRSEDFLTACANHGLLRPFLLPVFDLYLEQQYLWLAQHPKQPLDRDQFLLLLQAFHPNWFLPISQTQ